MECRNLYSCLASVHPLAQLLRWSPPGFGYKIFYFCMSCVRLIMEHDLGEASHCQGHWKFGNTKLSFVWSLPAVVSLSILTLGLFNSLQVHSDLSDRMPWGTWSTVKAGGKPDDPVSMWHTCQEGSWMTLFLCGTQGYVMRRRFGGYLRWGKIRSLVNHIKSYNYADNMDTQNVPSRSPSRHRHAVLCCRKLSFRQQGGCTGGCLVDSNT